MFPLYFIIDQTNDVVSGLRDEVIAYASLKTALEFADSYNRANPTDLHTVVAVRDIDDFIHLASLMSKK